MRTLFQIRRLAQAIRKINKYLAIMGIAEARWTGAGKQRLNSGETIICSGRQDNNHQEVVELIIDSKYANTLLQWKPISERLLYVRLNARHSSSPLLWPTLPLKTLMKRTKMISTSHCTRQMTTFHDTSCSCLETLVQQLDVTTRTEKVMGKHGVGDLTDNGERVINL